MRFGPRHLRFFIRLMAAAGCSTILAGMHLSCITAKYFLLPDEKQTYPIFEDHLIDVGIYNNIYGNNYSLFEIHLGQEYIRSNVDSSKIDTYPMIKVDSLCIELDCDSVPYCPSLTEIYDKRSICTHGNVIGPSYSWGWRTIPDNCRQMVLRFNAYLIDPATDSTVKKEPVEMTLSRVHDKMPSWVK